MSVAPISKVCPKCKTLFSCQSDNIASCQCSTVRLSKETIQFLSNTNFDCLCKTCLEKINKDVSLATQFHFPTHKAMYIEGLHYYKENNYWVFTELYHTLRGKCCQSGCRHCVYGFGNKG
ncbi:cysteine-rich CWC family protein [Dyadobacter sp. NIV53]|uniref:cysteine-rich CWC family protein n=1 Tax=Dyadobacter sp. NIV53 TaxID=2861765 RepID=UPI001C886148|nr:cysteine-rich CWC family protein [Dyadobacter sp. NIV53]